MREASRREALVAPRWQARTYANIFLAGSASVNPDESAEYIILQKKNVCIVLPISLPHANPAIRERCAEGSFSFVHSVGTSDILFAVAPLPADRRSTFLMGGS